MEITCRWSNRVTDLTLEDWEFCYGTGSENVLTSYSLQRALERSQLADRFYYLSLYYDGRLTAIVSCFSQRYSLTDLAPPRLQDRVETLRKLYPGLLRTRIFVVGSPIATCTHTLGFALGPDHPNYPRLVRAMEREINRKASDLRIRLLCIKELDSYSSTRLKSALQSDFIIRRSLDTTYVRTAPVAGLDYVENMLSRYRKALKKRKEAFRNAGLRWILVDDFGLHAETLHSLYLNVLQRSRTKFERLTSDFFRAVNEELGEQSRALLCLNGKRIVAFELLLNGRQLHPLYLGIDYCYRDTGALYFNCLYSVIEEAQRQGLSYIELGQTSYEAKFSVGAVSSPRYFYIKHANPLCNALLRLLREHIFPTPQIPPPRRVFRHNENCIDTSASSEKSHAGR